MYAKLITSGTRGLISPNAECFSGSTPLSGDCINYGYTPGWCRAGLIIFSCLIGFWPG